MRTRDLATISAALLTLALISGCQSTGPRSRSSEAVAAVAEVGDSDAPHDHTDEPKDIRSSRSAPDLGPRLRARTIPELTAAAEPVWYGLLHAHTYFSDGSGTPTQAYARAKEKNLSFFAVTEHNHAAAEAGAKERADKVLIATTPDLYNSTAPVAVRREPKNGPPQTVTVSSVISAARAASDGSFIGLYGQEFSTISSGNHLNVLQWDDVLTVPNGSFKELYNLIDTKVGQGTPLPVIQLNHPNFVPDLFLSSTKSNEKRNDYGFDDYGKDFRALVNASDRYVCLIEVLSGPAMTEESHQRYHYNDSHERDYYYYLSQGYHLSPSVGHDNHYPTWGDATPARMGVYASNLTPDELYRAMRANRTFATEDSDLAVQLTINGQSMGSVLTVPAGGTLELALTVQDPTDPSAQYEATLVHGFVEPQRQSTLTRLDLADGEVETYVLDTSTVSLDPQRADGSPEFYYVRITQQTDGDRAWTAPIWINHARNRPLN
jgi:hypothetical protein